MKEKRGINSSREPWIKTEDFSSLKLMLRVDKWQIDRGKNRINLNRCHLCIKLVPRARDHGRETDRILEQDQGLDQAQEVEVIQESDLAQGQERFMTLA